MKKVEDSTVRASLITRSLIPENKETPIQFLKDDSVSDRLFYRRNHFSYPNFLSSFYYLPIEGFVYSSKTFSMQEILTFPPKTLKVVLECAGDKRGLFKPKVFGEQWEKGAISQGSWKGVPLRTLLKFTGLHADAKEIVVEGYDVGERTDFNEIVPFSRSLPLEKALDSNTIIAYEYNGHPIPFKHGYPLRLIVPGWYAMASVKWIKRIKVIDKQFKGPFQAIDYFYYPHEENDNENFPVTTINVNSNIQKPLDMQMLNTGIHEIKGIAWTGVGKITKVDISLDNGATWNACQFTSSTENHAWTHWAYIWEIKEPGEYTILIKATDSEGNVQPEKPMWNRKGYGYNAIEHIKLKIE
ncbi:sulfite oxidase [Priestia aryabhattai]|uniref:sulfite oxidase n=1 Tax=Priestia aryabhattai TaxID=412384 RepID=UPI001C8EB64B|nr:sulfite oxidase [Priestia aryabhattai]MBY0029890.1 sulfite oxidase [Priestia aryabhattai]